MVVVGWVGEWVVVWKPIFVSNPTQLSYDEDVLRLCWGCDNNPAICFPKLRLQLQLLKSPTPVYQSGEISLMGW